MIIGKCPVCGEEIRIGSDMTNADRIRSMTDTELSYLISDNVECNKACKAKREGCLYSDSTCIAAWLEWLKEEVKDDR